MNLASFETQILLSKRCARGLMIQASQFEFSAKLTGEADGGAISLAVDLHACAPDLT